MSQESALTIDVYKLTCEQRQQLFLELFNADPSLLNMINSEFPVPDARSAVHGITNEQVYFIFIVFVILD